MRRRGRGVHSGSLGSFKRALRVVGLLGFVGFIWGLLGGCPVHLCWLGSFGCAVVVVGFVYWGLSCSLGYFGFIRARHWRRTVHSGSLGSF